MRNSTQMNKISFYRPVQKRIYKQINLCVGLLVRAATLAIRRACRRGLGTKEHWRAVMAADCFCATLHTPIDGSHRRHPRIYFTIKLLLYQFSQQMSWKFSLITNVLEK